MSEIIAPKPVTLDDSIPESIRARYRELAEEWASLEKTILHAAVAESVAAEFPDFVSQAPVTISETTWITLSITDVQQIVAIRRELARRGYHVKDVRDYPEDRRRIFRLGGINLDCYFNKGEGARCRYVKTGTKEVPVYELVCDGADAEEARS